MRIPDHCTVFGDGYTARMYANGFCIINFWGLGITPGETYAYSQFDRVLGRSSLCFGVPMYQRSGTISAPSSHVNYPFGLYMLFFRSRSIRLVNICIDEKMIADLKNVRYPDLDEIYTRCMSALIIKGPRGLISLDAGREILKNLYKTERFEEHSVAIRQGMFHSAPDIVYGTMPIRPNLGRCYCYYNSDPSALSMAWSKARC